MKKISKVSEWSVLSHVHIMNHIQASELEMLSFGSILGLS